MKERKFKPCSTKQLLNMLKLWCERDGWQIFTSARRTCLFNGLASAKKISSEPLYSNLSHVSSSSVSKITFNLSFM